MSGCSLNPAEHPLQKLHKESKHVRHPEALGKMADRRMSGSRTCASIKSEVVQDEGGTCLELPEGFLIAA
uniref:Uncharacterized protein n=1 Tax=Knipowitschia caucasica TaxID=637954 RepID=A0AAV2JV82_KNICA